MSAEGGDSPADYIPLDRRKALAEGTDLPHKQVGSAVFADISGFTPLTTLLTQTMGLRRGAEELPIHLERVYDALIEQVHRFGGSVIGFAGDAITCWFDGDDGTRASSSAVAMQAVMNEAGRVFLPGGQALTLELKVAVATGPVRRMVVGNEDIQLMDVIAGQTLERLAAADGLAGSGEVILDESTARSLGEDLEVREWRQADGRRFAVVGALRNRSAGLATSTETSGIPQRQAKPWLIPEVYARLEAGQGAFLTELRPVTAVFLSFAGIDYDTDPDASLRLNAFIRRVQTEAARLEGTLLQVTVGDKGNYLYLGFGAPVSNEDDSTRAVIAALRLMELADGLGYIRDVRIGISQGTMRTGAYGGHGRRTYGALGEETNMAARLMGNAAAGQVLASRQVLEGTSHAFEWQEHGSIMVKGRALPLAVFEPVRAKSAGALTGQASTGSLIGRSAELRLLRKEFGLARAGEARVVTVTGEAGIGKTRLIAALVAEEGAAASVLVGEAESYTADSPYYPWQPVIREILGRGDRSDAAAHLERAVRDLSPELLPRLPLLAPVLNLVLPDSELTASLDPELRKASREALLLELIRLAARRAEADGRVLLLILEDLQWFDTLSSDLLQVVARGLGSHPVLLILSRREDGVRIDVGADALSVPLGSLTDDEANELLQARISSGRVMDELPADAISQLLDQAEGNPYYLEELADYLAALGPGQISEASTELPAGLHSLILSRIDRLSEHNQAMLKASSIIGRRFALAWLDGYYPSLGGIERVTAAAVELSRLDLTVPEGKQAGNYAFRQAIARDVTYESIPFALRSSLHGRLAGFIEEHVATQQEPMLEILALHHGLGTDLDSQRKYFRLAGEAAQASYANEAALNWFARLLPLVEGSELGELLRRQGQVLMHTGDYAAAKDSFERSLAAARSIGDQAGEARGMRHLGELLEKQGDYLGAVSWLERAKAVFEDLEDRLELVQVLLALGGNVLWQQGEYEAAHGWLTQALELAGSLEDDRSVARSQHGLGNIELHQGNLEAARRFFEDSLVTRKAIGDSLGIANALNNLGIIAANLGSIDQARELFGESLEIRRAIGDRAGSAVALNNLGFMAAEVGSPDEAFELYLSSLSLCREIGDRTGTAVTLNSLGHLEFTRGRSTEAAGHFSQGLSIAHEIGNLREVAAALVGIAAVRVGIQSAAAVRLAGAAQAQLARIGAAMEQEVDEMYAHVLATAGEQLNATSVEREHAKGAGLDLDSCVSFGLQLVRDH